MTTGAYDDDIATALELVTEFGQVCEWRKTVVTDDNPDRPWLGGEPVTTVHNPSIVFIPSFEAHAGYGLLSFVKNQDVTQYSTFGLMAPSGFDPDLTDVVLRGTEQLMIKAVDSIRPAKDVVLYILSIV